MKTQKSSMLTLTVILVALASTASEAAPRSTPVTVVNDAASPVPIEGVVDANVVGIPGVTIENGTLEPVPVTNVGQPASGEIIQLGTASGGGFVCGTGDVGRRFGEIFRGGLISANSFSIPTDKLLIVTSISLSTDGAAPAQSIPFSIGRGIGGFGNTAFRSRVMTDANGAGSSVTTLTPGFATTADLCFFPPTTGTSQLHVYGYLVDR